MSSLNTNWSITGVDLKTEQVDDCNKFFTKIGRQDQVKYVEGDLTTFVSKEHNNLILCVDVMEHIEEDVLVFKNFFGSLHENGTLVISTPSDQGGSDVHDESESSFIDEHVRDGYGIKDITEKLTLAGFTGIRAVYTYGRPGNISWRLSMKYPVKMLNTSYIFFLVLPFYYILFFPVSLILNVFDLLLTHKKGTGLLVTARKQQN